MIRLLKNILVFFVAFVVIAGMLPKYSYAEYGATIEATNCDPAADPALDYLRTETDPDFPSVYPTKSCVGQNISLSSIENPYKLKIQFIPDQEFIGIYVAQNLAALIVVYGGVYWAAHTSTFSAVMYACNYLCSPAAFIAANYSGYIALVGAVTVAITSAINVSGDNVYYIGVGESKNLISGGPLGSVAKVEISQEGDKSCANLVTLPLPLFNFTADRADGFNSKYGIAADTPLPSNCVYAPPPVAVTKPPVPAFISQSCIDYDTSASQFRWPEGVSGGNGGKSRSFTGVVVQCVEDTMTNLFFNARSGGVGAAESVFVKTQKQLIDMIRAMLALYVVLIGYKYLIGEKSGTKRNDFIWMGLRVALVLYFAGGAGMTTLLPGILSSMKNLSAIIIDAGSGANGEMVVDSGVSVSADRVEKREALEIAKNDYEAKRAAYSNARINWAQYTPEVLGYTEEEKENKEVIMNEAKATMDAANKVFDDARLATLSYGYDYCDFSAFAQAGKYNYTSTEEGKIVTRDMSYMRLWDSIDCRLAKYLGVGTDVNFPSTPKVLLIGIGSLFGSILGLMIFILSFIFILFVVLITIRIVHIYLIAFIAIILLVYISPLVIPMVLFSYTKSSFDAWLKQLVAFTVQPIILFAFLALMFSIFDSVMYGDNYDFLPVNKSELVTSPKVSDNTIAKVHSSDGSVCADQTASDCVYADKDALGYLYQKAGVVSKDIKIEGATVFSIFSIKKLSDSAVVSVDDMYDVWTKDGSDNSKVVDFGNSDYLKIMIGLLKVTFMCFIMHALLGQAEEMSKTLTNIAGGAASLSATPTADPGKIGEKLALPALKQAGSAGMKAGGFALKQTVGRALKGARRAGVKSGMDK